MAERKPESYLRIFRPDPNAPPEWYSNGGVVRYGRRNYITTADHAIGGHNIGEGGKAAVIDPNTKKGKVHGLVRKGPADLAAGTGTRRRGVPVGDFPEPGKEVKVHWYNGDPPQKLFTDAVVTGHTDRKPHGEAWIDFPVLKVTGGEPPRPGISGALIFNTPKGAKEKPSAVASVRGYPGLDQKVVKDLFTVTPLKNALEQTRPKTASRKEPAVRKEHTSKSAVHM